MAEEIGAKACFAFDDIWRYVLISTNPTLCTHLMESLEASACAMHGSFAVTDERLLSDPRSSCASDWRRVDQGLFFAEMNGHQWSVDDPTSLQFQFTARPEHADSLRLRIEVGRGFICLFFYCSDSEIGGGYSSNSCPQNFDLEAPEQVASWLAHMVQHLRCSGAEMVDPLSVDYFVGFRPRYVS